MAPKNKGKKLALADFFADPTTGSWADDLDNLPTAPAARDPSAPKRGEPGYLDSMPDRGQRQTFPGAPPSREELPLPTAPPFTAFIGNLSFDDDVDEKVREFFTDLQPTTVRIVKDPTGKPKGFGYVEFPSQDALKEALGRSGNQVQGRTIRVSVAEASQSRRDIPSSAAEEASQWRRTTPLPARADSGSAGGLRRGPPSFSASASAEPGPERDWGSARGAKFTPAPPVQERERERSFTPRTREVLPSQADEVNQWRSNKPLQEPVAARGQGRDLPPHQRSAGPASEQDSPRLADTEQTWSRGTKLRTPAPEASAAPSVASPVEEKDWRSARPTPDASRQGSTDGESPRQAPAPLERRKLQLAPRSVPATPSSTASAAVGSDDSAPPASARSSIFGSAKPIDSAAKEQAAAEKIAARDEERKKAREAEIAKKREEDEKARQFAEERQAAIRAAVGEPATGGAGAGAKGGQGQRHPHGNQRGGHAQQGQGQRVHPSRKQSDGPKSPRPQAGTSAVAGGKDEEGFEAVQSHAHGRRSSQQQTQQQQQEAKIKRDASTRPQFSFAAAAKAEGFVEGNTEDEVKEVTNGVEEVKV